MSSFDFVTDPRNKGYKYSHYQEWEVDQLRVDIW